MDEQTDCLDDCPSQDFGCVAECGDDADQALLWCELDNDTCADGCAFAALD